MRAFAWPSSTGWEVSITRGGNHARAESIYRRALAISEQALGPDQLSAALCLHHLAIVCHDMGKYVEAEALYQRAQAIFDKALDPDDALVATNLNGLAGTYRYQEKFTEAEPLYRRALAILEKRLGPDHLQVGYCLLNLAGLLREKDTTEPRFGMRVEGEVPLPEHPVPGWSPKDVALHVEQTWSDETEPLYRRALAIAEKTYGPDHPSVGFILHHYALLQRKTGRDAEAQDLHARLEIIKTKHPLMR